MTSGELKVEDVLDAIHKVQQAYEPLPARYAIICSPKEYDIVKQFVSDNNFEKKIEVVRSQYIDPSAMYVMERSCADSIIEQERKWMNVPICQPEGKTIQFRRFKQRR